MDHAEPGVLPLEAVIQARSASEWVSCILQIHLLALSAWRQERQSLMSAHQQSWWFTVEN